MKKPYLKKFCKISIFNVWIVAGNFIRKNIDEEFTNFGQHHRFKFIPKNEFWIDKEYGKGNEKKYFIDHMLVENRLMKKGISYVEASDKADKIEKSERSKSKLISKLIKNKLEVKKEIYLKLLKSNKRIKIWLVNGNLVRSLFFIDFVQGGHDKIYHFIPKNEIWIDDDVNPKERKFVLLHELFERNLMCKGWSYEENRKKFISSLKEYISHKKPKLAHWAASEIECYYRHHPKRIDKKIFQELKNSTQNL